MGWISGIVVYLIVWWTVIFVVLPFGNIRDSDETVGHAPGAPQISHIKRKFIMTSLIAAAVWVVIYLLITYEVLSFRVLAQRLGAP